MEVSALREFLAVLPISDFEADHHCGVRLRPALTQLSDLPSGRADQARHPDAARWGRRSTTVMRLLRRLEPR